MAEHIALVRPGAGQTAVHPVGPAARLELAFNQDEADVSKEGQDLVFTFADGGTLVLEDFYSNFGDKAQPPTLIVQGYALDGEAFLAAYGNPDLMPAAGPDAATLVMGGGLYDTEQLGGVQGMSSLGKLGFDGMAPVAPESPGVDGETSLPAQFPVAASIGWSAAPSGPPVVPPPVVPPPPPIVPPPPPPPPFTLSFTGRTTVSEAGLPGGSAEGSQADDVRGVFTIANAQGAAYMRVDGQEVDLNGLAQGYVQTFTTPLGRLVLTNYDPATGKVNYAYTLTHALHHAAPGDPAGLDQIAPGDSFTITAGDAGGNVLSAPLTISVRDDAPVAHDDYIAIKTSTLANLAPGTEGAHSLLDNDIRSADGQSITGLSFDQGAHIQNITGDAAHGWQVVTDYGVFTVDAQGGYAFAPDAGFNALDGSVQISFRYTLTDGDGDQSAAGVTLDLYNQQQSANPNLAPQIMTSEFAVNDIVTATGNTQGGYGMYSKVAALADGDYVVAWQNGGAIYTQLYNPLGQPVGAPVTVTSSAYAGASTGYDHSDDFTISATPDGGYLVTWDNSSHSTGYGQLYDSAGNALGGPMFMAANDYYGETGVGGWGNVIDHYNWSSSTQYTQERDSIALSKGGYIVIACDNDGNYYNVNMAILNSNGQLANTTINNGTGVDPVIALHDYMGHTFNGQVAEIAPDRIAVVYCHSTGSGYSLGTGNASGSALEGPNYADMQGSSGSILYMSIFDLTRDANGNIVDASRVGTEISISNPNGSTNKFPEITALEDGRFAVVWQSEVMAGGITQAHVEVQVFNSDGSAATGFEQPHDVSSGSGYQLVPDVTSLPGGGFVVVWTEMDPNGAGTGYDILARRYDAAGNPTGAPVEIARGVEGYSQDGEYGTQRHPDVTVLADGRIVVTWTTMSGKVDGVAEVHHQILAPDVFGGAAPLPQYISGQEDLHPLAAAILGAYDPDADAPGAARVQLADPHSGDTLSLDADWCAAHGVTVQTLSGGTLLVITVADTSLSSADQWQLITQAIQKVGYANSLPENQIVTGDRTITVTVSDAKGASSSVDAQFQVVAHNDAPVLALSGGDEHLQVVMNDIVSIITPDRQVRITDTEMDDIVTARIAITNYAQGVDHLSLDLPAGDPRFAGITAAFDTATGILTISGAAPASVYQQVLSYVQYQCTSAVPLLEDRILSVSVSDGMGLYPYSAPLVIAVTTEHPTAPVISAAGDPDAAYGYGSGSRPVTAALHDGGYAMCVKTAAGIELSTYNANGEARDVHINVSGVDSVTSLTQLADGSLVLLGQQSGQSVLAHMDGNGQTQIWNSAFSTITDVLALPGGGCMVAGVAANGDAAWAAMAADGTPGAVHAIGAASVAHPNVEMAMLPDGSATVVYEAANGATQVVCYDPAGNQLNQPFTLPNEVVNDPGQVSICALSNGQYAVTWCSGEHLAIAPNASEILAGQVFNADGTLSGDRFYIDTVAYAAHGDLQTIPLENGAFAVVWSNSNSGGDKEVFVSVMNANGAQLLYSAMPHTGAEVQPSVSALADGGWVVAWQDAVAGAVQYQVFNDDGSQRDTGFYAAHNDPITVFHDVSIVDPNHDDIGHATVTIDGFKAGDELVFRDDFDPAAHGMTVHYDAGNGVLTIDGQASAEDYQNALDALTFQNVDTGSVAGVRDIHVTLWDASNAAQNQSNPLSSAIEVHDNASVLSGSGLPGEVLHGSIGNDVIIGHGGGNVLDGGLGNDLLVGGAGADIFAWSRDSMGGTDIVKNFNQAEGDKLHFSDLFGGGTDSGQLLANLLDSHGAWDSHNQVFTANNGQESITVSWTEHSTVLTVTDSGHTQNVILEGITQSAFTSDQEDAQHVAQMLHEIITVGGN